MVTRLRQVAVAVLLLLSPAAVFSHSGSEQRLIELEAQIAAEPNSGRLYLRRGEIHRELEHWAVAWADYGRALEISESIDAADPGLSSDITFCMGRMQLDKGDAAQALKLFQSLEDQGEGYLPAKLYSARALVALGRGSDALGEMDRFLAANSQANPDYDLERAAIALQTGDNGLELAIRGLEKAVQRSGSLVQLVEKLVELYAESGQLQPALNAIAGLPTALQETPLWLSRTGDLYFRAERPNQAREYYNRTLTALAELPPSRRRTPANRNLHETVVLQLDRIASEGIDNLTF